MGFPRKRGEILKLVKLIKTFDHCFACPFHSGGRGLGSPLYCTYFDPPRQITDSNGYFVTEVLYKESSHNFIAKFCELPENKIVEMD